MKNNGKFYKFIFNLSMIFVLIIGLSIPSPVSQTAFAEEEDEEEEESGFLVEADQVEGTIDIIEFLGDSIDMDEGELTGLTLTQESESADGQTLIVKIHSEGPVPVENLEGEIIEADVDILTGLCPPSEIGWLCLEDVEMELSSQEAGAISLPDASVETCFEGECEGVGDVDGTDLDVDDIELEDMNMNNLNELLDTVEEMVEDARGVQQTIQDEEQVSAVEQSINEAEGLIEQPDDFSEVAGTVDNTHEELNENVTDMGVITANADDTLKQISNQIDMYEQRIEEEEEALIEQWEIEPEEFEAYLDELDTDEVDEEELPDVDTRELKDEISDLQARMSASRGDIDDLTADRQALTEDIEGFHADASELADAVEGTDEYDEDQREAVLQDLDVAEPGKTVGKQMTRIDDELEENESQDHAEELETLTEEATEEIEESGMSVELAEEIGETTDEINEKMEADLEEANQNMEQHQEDIEAVESRLNELSEQVDVPEALAGEYEINELPEEEQNEYRLDMQANISEWEEQYGKLMGDMGNQDLQALLQEEQEDLQAMMNELREYVEGLEDDLSEEEFNALMEGLDLDEAILEDDEDDEEASEEDEATEEEESSEADEEKQRDELEAQLDEALQYGDEHAQAVQPILEDATIEIEEMESLSEELASRFLGMDSLNDEEAEAFEEHLGYLDEQMDALAEPATGLQEEISTAEALEEELETSNEELEQLKDTAQEVEALKDDMDDVQDNLNELSFTRTNDFVDEIEYFQEDIENWFE